MKQARVLFTLSLLAAVTYAQDLAGTYAKLQGAAPEVIVSALGCDDVTTRELALAQIARESRVPALAQAAAEALAHVARQEVRAQLIAALAERGDQAAVPAIRRALKDADPQVRAAAAAACGRFKDAKAADALFEMLGGEQGEVAREALRRIPGKSVDARLVKQVRRGQGAERVSALDLLAARRAVGIFELALDPSLFTAGDAALAKSAAGAVRAYAPADSFGRLLDFSLSLPAPSAELLAGTLAATFGEAADKSACERRVCDALASCGHEHAALLTALLASGQGSGALHALSVRLEADSLDVRKDAVRNLGKWNSQAALAPLVMAAKRERDAGAQTLAWRAVLDIVRRSDKIADASQAVSAIHQALWHAPRREERVAALEALPLYHPKAFEVEWLLAKVEAEKPELATDAGRVKGGLVPPLADETVK